MVATLDRRNADPLDPPMTVAEFFAFTADRPDGERWELIDGEPILNAPPTRLHQLIALNIAGELRNRLRGSPYVAALGISLTISDTSAPVPDVMAMPRDVPADVTTEHMTVVFEVLSPSTSHRDRRWKRRAYTSAPARQTYVIVAQDTVEVLAFERASGFSETRLTEITDVLSLPALGVSLPLAEIYRDTGYEEE
jgi:Uma2 family endonuclease